jgi:hypothetical protein
MKPLLFLLLLLGSLQDAPATRPATNPFRGDDELLRRLGLLPGEGGYTPMHDPSALPSMRLRGLLKLRDRKAAALLDVEGVGALIVREGDQVSLAGAPSTGDGLPPALKIERIGPEGVVVEVGTLGRSLVIR